MIRDELEKYAYLIIKLIVYLAIAGAGYFAFRVLVAYFMPFIIAFLLSLILEPLVKLLERFRISRGISVAISILLFLGTFITFSIFAVTRVLFEVSKLYSMLPKYYDKLYTIASDIVQQATDLYLQLPPEATNIVHNIIKTVFDKLTIILSSTATSLIDSVKAMPGMLVFSLITIIATFFITKDRALIKNFLLRQLSESWRLKITSLQTDLFSALLGFLKAQIIILSVTFTESYIGLSLIGIEYAFILAVVIALVDILPILGTGTIYIPWAIVNILMGNYRLGISLLVLYGVITVVRYMIEPKVVGQQLGIHPIVALMSIFVGLNLIGVAGVILGPTFVVVIKAFQQAGIIPKFK